MVRRSQRIKEMSQGGNERVSLPLAADGSAAGSSSESEHEKTIVGQDETNASETMASLGEEIRVLKSSLQMFMGSSNTPTSVALPQQSNFNQNAVTAPTTLQYSFASMPSHSITTPQTSTSKKISIDHQHMFRQHMNSPQNFTS
ncbi:uncharacterized protein LOC142223012 [Haematobia irritans]|uniref:uncharacterized protein LOC142223012 n=1 Tax=Haematobia irritans TaxID=7368 RepID=UPI003F506952